MRWLLIALALNVASAHAGQMMMQTVQRAVLKPTALEGMKRLNPIALWLFDEASGNFVDIVGGVTLTAGANIAYSQPSVNTGGQGRSARATSGIVFGSAADPDQFTLTNCTFICWTTSATMGGNYGFLSKDDCANEGFIGIYEATFNFYSRNSPAARKDYIGAAHTAQIPRLVQFGWTGTTANCYVNGAVETTGISWQTPGANNNAFEVGADSACGGGVVTVSGQRFQTLAIYDYELSLAQHAWLYSLGIP